MPVSIRQALDRLQGLIAQEWPLLTFRTDLSLSLTRQEPQLLSASTAATHPRQPPRVQYAAYAKTPYV